MLRVATLDDLVRWTRVLSELTEVAGKLSPTTAKSIYNEVTQRLVVSWRCMLTTLQASPHEHRPKGQNCKPLLSWSAFRQEDWSV